MAVALLGLILAAIPVVVIPGVLSTFGPIKTTLTGALGLFAVALVVAVHLSCGTFSFAAIADAVAGIRMVRGVSAVGVWSLASIAAISVLGSITSVASDTSWFGSLGGGQGTLFVITVAAVVALAGPVIATVGGIGVGTML